MSIDRRTFVSGIAAALAMPAIARGQEVVKLTAIAGHPPVFLWVKLFDEMFITEVDKRLAASGAKVKIEWTKAYGGTLAKLGTELEAIRDGIADIGFVSSVFQAPQLPLQNVTYVAPFGSGDIATVTSVVEKLQDTIPAMGEAWTRNKQVFLGSAALDDYHLFTTFPVKSIDDLKGRKIMAPGPSANWVNGTGAVAVASTLPEYYNNMKTGVAEGVLTFVTGAVPIKLWEVAGHLTRTSFGAQYGGGLTIAQAKLGRLPAEAQKIFRDVGKDYSVAFAKAQAERVDAGLKTMQDAGLKVADLAPAERERWAKAIPNTAKKWAEDLEAKKLPGKAVLKGYMDGLKAAGVKVPRDWSAE
jgi:TRAP-type C4-dicarboxylate transport system substrate-binding protein